MVMETIQCIRKNHALEHATIAVLIEKGYQTPLVGLSTPYGFFIFGKLTKEDIAKAIKIALGRLDNGETGLAVSAFCGTNILTTGVISAVAAVIMNHKDDKPLRRLQNVVTAVIGAQLLSGPIGKFLQKNYTTLADMNGVEISNIKQTWKQPRGGNAVHFVKIQSRPQKSSP